MKYLNNIYLRILFIVLILVYIVIQSYKGGDFKIYLGAAELLKEGKSCYNVWIPLGGNNSCGYSYSPFFAILLIPLTYLINPLPQFIWLLLNVFFLYRIWKIIASYVDASRFSNKQYLLWVTLTLLASLRFILHNFEMVQMTIFLAFCCLESVYQAQKNNYVKSGLILSLGIMIKILPLIILPYLIYRREIKSLLITLIGIACFLFFPVLLYGWSFNNSLISEWWSIINPNNKEYISQQNLHGEGVHSLSGLVAGYFMYKESAMTVPFHREIMNLNSNSLFWILNIFRMFFAGFTLYFLRSLPLTSFQNKHHTMWELSYILATVPLIFPHQQKYSFFFLMPATAFIIHFLIAVWKYDKLIFSIAKYRLCMLFLILFFLMSTITTDGIVGDYFNYLSEYYKTITFGTFFLLVSLSICNPSIFNSQKNINAFN